MCELNIDKLKIESVHTGLLDSIILLRSARNKINELTEEEEIRSWTKSCRRLEEIGEQLCHFAGDVSDIIGSILSERVETELDNFFRKKEDSRK